MTITNESLSYQLCFIEGTLPMILKKEDRERDK